jgi:2-polyprenyl-3-methyl-5-hydroxy-6-metoxy-1,4-benzoquinol methylase
MNEESEIRSVWGFYDRLAADYHLIFDDWRQAIVLQSGRLDVLIQAQSSRSLPMTLLDCSCDIGTQAIGLAQRGYTVHATDLSPVAVERARQEALTMGVEITFGVADFRTLAKQVEGAFDVVLSCDNALPHLLGDTDLHLAVENRGEHEAEAETRRVVAPRHP